MWVSRDTNWSKITHRCCTRAFSTIIKSYWAEITNEINNVLKWLNPNYIWRFLANFPNLELLNKLNIKCVGPMIISAHFGEALDSKTHWGPVLAHIDPQRHLTKWFSNSPWIEDFCIFYFFFRKKGICVYSKKAKKQVFPSPCPEYTKIN